MPTPSDLIQLAVNSGKEIDRLYPGLRQQDADAWMAKVAYLGFLSDRRIGRKSRGPGARVSPDTVGIKVQEPNSNDSPFYAVSIIRDNPGINEWRLNEKGVPTPEDHGLISGQLWIAPEIVDIGEPPVNPPNPEPGNSELAKLVFDLAAQVGVASNALYEVQKKLYAMGQLLK